MARANAKCGDDALLLDLEDERRENGCTVAVMTSLPLDGVRGDDDRRGSLDERRRGDRRGEDESCDLDGEIFIRPSTEDERIILNGDERGETLLGTALFDEEAT